MPWWPLRCEEACLPSGDTAGQCTTENLNSDNWLENVDVGSFSRVPPTTIQITLFIEELKK